MCPVLEDLENGRVSWTGLTPGSNATYSCDGGWVLDGAQNRICQDNGTWSNEPPSCIGIVISAKAYMYIEKKVQAFGLL